MKKYKLKGLMLLSTIVAVVAWILLAGGIFLTQSSQFSMLTAQKSEDQARQYAALETQRVSNIDYEELDDYAAHSRKQIEGAEDGWESEVTIDPEKTLSDGSGIRTRTSHINIYKTGDTIPRYSLDVPTSSVQSATPVGSVIAWPSATAPTSGGVWLECNGQTIDAKYQRLRELVGDHTPNYQGVFLRGYGSQTIANTFQGWVYGYGKQTFSSEKLGSVQTDSTRNHVYITEKQLVWDDWDFGLLNTVFSHNIGTVSGVDFSKWYGASWSEDVYNKGSGYNYPSPGFFQETIWALKRPPKKYSLENTDGGADDSESVATLTESEDTDSGRYVNIWGSNWSANNGLENPTDTEIRPVNIAVRYFIKAR